MITTCTTCGGLYEAGSEEQANEPSRWCPPCWSEHKDRSKQVFDGPFVARANVGLPGNCVYYVASDPKTGVCCPSRDQMNHAEADALALNAAYTLGKDAGREASDAAVYAAYQQIRMAAIPGGNGHFLVPETAIAALRSALYSEVRHG